MVCCLRPVQFGWSGIYRGLVWAKFKAGTVCAKMDAPSGHWSIQYAAFGQSICGGLETTESMSVETRDKEADLFAIYQDNYHPLNNRIL